ncbi:MAG: restriction endonuclease [Epsilonproteobacteria bacterium]|nr:MAG: restriction endonuclease [Campylobacterota bacterium]
MTNKTIKFAKAFGKKEKVLNYTSSTYQLTRPNKVDAVMALIRECQPKTIVEWEEYYFKEAYTKRKDRDKITKETLDDLGERLYSKVTEVVIPEWTEAFKNLTLQDCKDYIYEVTIVRTYDGFLLEKSVVNDGLSKIFTDIKFEESDPELDHAGDIDYLGYVGKYAFGIQIKPITAGANFANYNISDRMSVSFEEFSATYSGKVFVVFSARENNTKNIVNTDVIEDIRLEIKRLENLSQK